MHTHCSTTIFILRVHTDYFSHFDAGHVSLSRAISAHRDHGCSRGHRLASSHCTPPCHCTPLVSAHTALSHCTIPYPTHLIAHLFISPHLTTHLLITLHTPSSLCTPPHLTAHPLASQHTTNITSVTYVRKALVTSILTHIQITIAHDHFINNASTRYLSPYE